ncbi:MAG TPA: hypothetical protein VLI04_21115 [Nocardioidaceae bacterium]|nr:hypothetical protein [Nocardioidaceae bacterium]
MTLYRISSIFLVLSCFCLAIAVALGDSYYTVISTICVLLASQCFASGIEQETGAPNWHA